jgi:hypothetical protein
MIIDQTNDTGYARLRVLMHQFPEMRGLVKTANVGPEEFQGLPDSAFAWPGRRQFPVHTREHATMSLGYRKYAAAVPQDVDDMLKKAAEIYQIDTKIFDKTVTKQAAQEKFLLPEKQRFKVASADDIQFAEKVLHEKYATLSIEDRTLAFYNLCKYAEQFGVKLTPATHKLAGFTITSTKTLKDWMETRKMAAEKLGSSYASAYEKLAQMFDKVEPFVKDRPYQLKIAAAIAKLDRESGVDKFYNKSIPDPVRTVFNMDKLASETMKIGTGMLANKQFLSSLPVSFWEDALGPDIVKEIAPDGQNVDVELLEQVLPTLPADIKATVQSQLAAYGK